MKNAIFGVKSEISSWNFCWFSICLSVHCFTRFSGHNLSVTLNICYCSKSTKE